MINNMALKIILSVVILSVLLSKVFSYTYEINLPAECPCRQKSLCKSLNLPPRKETFFISADTRNWKYYDYSKMTTLSLFGPWNPEVMCHAHSMNIRVVFLAGVNVNKLHNPSYRQSWIKNTTLLALARFADGVNLDIEDGVSPGSQKSKDITVFTKEFSQVFHEMVPGSQITFDVFYTGNCSTTGQCYEFSELAKYVDFFTIESYDEWNMWSKPCHAGPNAGFNKTIAGVVQYMNLGINQSQLVPMLPWYGYNYKCLNYTKKTCFIKSIHNIGGWCSDAAGHQEGFSLISLRLEHSLYGKHFDKRSISPYFEYLDSHDHSIHQVWYDDYTSLPEKYHYALKKLRGLGIFHLDCLYYGKNQTRMAETWKMWDALPNKPGTILWSW